MTNMVFYVPGSRHYENGTFANRPNSYANISVTGTACRCQCEHCQGQLLRSMFPVTTPEELVQLARNLYRQGCRGVLISGGADRDGSVPLLPFAAALEEITAWGLAVVVHPGLLTPPVAAAMRTAKVTSVALDLIGDEDTIRDIYHLGRTPADYQASLRLARETGLSASPHIVVGLHYGKIRGEYAALEMVAREGAASLVFVILKPLPGTKMQAVIPPDLTDLTTLFETARQRLPGLPLALGCARPPGTYSRRAERIAIDAGFNGIAYPSDETVTYATSRGYHIRYQETCCGILDE